jgi:hypothetical protein
MAVWTVSAEAGTAGDRIAAQLGAAADVRVFDRDELAALAGELNPGITGADRISELEERIGGGGLTLLSFGVPFSPAAAECARELQLVHALPELARVVAGQAAREPCVISAPGGFAALGDQREAVHVRLRAPIEWRIARLACERVLDRRQAEKAIRHDDHVKRAWIKSMYHVDIDDPRHFSLVLDVSRFSHERLVDTMLAAGGIALQEPLATT